MAGALARVGPNSTGQVILLVVWLLTGLFLGAAFAVPDQLGAVFSARIVLFVAITFIGAGLVYLSLLPEDLEAAT